MGETQHPRFPFRQKCGQRRCLRVPHRPKLATRHFCLLVLAASFVVIEKAACVPDYGETASDAFSDDHDNDNENWNEEEFIDIGECPDPGKYDKQTCTDLARRGFCHHADLVDRIKDFETELDFDEDPQRPSHAGLTIRCCQQACIEYNHRNKVPAVENKKQLDEVLENIEWFLYESEPQKVLLKRRDESIEVIKVLREMDDYVRSELAVDSKYDDVREDCYNRHPLCAYWASIGECERAPWSMTKCAPVCKSCLDIRFSNRCPKDPDAVPIHQPGDQHAMFEGIANGAFDEFGPTIVSRPSSSEADDKPWVVAFENFVTDEECDRLIELGHLEGYERSADVGETRFDGSQEKIESSRRTSENAWCMGDCYEDPLAQAVMKRIAYVTGIPEGHSEYLQLLKYEAGQYYKRHSDFIPEDEGHPVGHRMLTFYLYLSNVEEGGGTNFPRLNITVMPKKGRAVLWPNVLNSNSTRIDKRTLHQALPVIRGRKFGANAWLHEFDFKTQNNKGCT